jgi:hypothetical protein
MRFINPKTDFAFKKIFGSNQSKPILISFLNAMIYDGNPTITDLEIIDPYLASRVQYLKDSYLDVKARLTGGTTVIIEMQVLNVESFAKRVVYNTAKTYSTQLIRGEGYFQSNYWFERRRYPKIAGGIKGKKEGKKSDRPDRSDYVPSIDHNTIGL